LYALIAIALVLLVASSAGVLTGAGVFIIALVSMRVELLAGAALLLTTSAGVSGAMYEWLTA
jgi:hypothetical protein